MAVGRLRPPFADDVAHYTKMLAGHARLELIEVREDERAERRIPERAYVSLLAADGEPAATPSASRASSSSGAMARRDLCFVIGGPFGLELERADHRLSLGPMTLPHQLARVVLLEQLFRAHKIIARRALPPLMARALRGPGLPAAPAPARADDRGRHRGGHDRARADRGPRGLGGLPVGAGHRRHHRLAPRPRDRPGPGRQGPADRAGRRYALLRPGDGDGGLRRRPSRRPARRAPDASRPSTPPATTTSSAASAAWAARSRATCARPGRATSSSTRCPRTASWPPGSACASSRARRPRTRSCAPAGIERARGGHRLRGLRRREHLHHADRARAAPRHRDRGPRRRPRTSEAKLRARGRRRA